jgi:GNAT superfamily N-acetyltransferase
MIKELNKNDFPSAVKILANCFTEDSLHIFAFPDITERIRLTKLVYEFIIYHMVPEMFLKIFGYFENTELLGVIIFSPFNPGRKWTDNLQDALEDMRAKAKNERINLIGEFARESASINIPFDYLYVNELGVLKKYRGKGIGEKLLKNTEFEALKSGTNFVTLDTTSITNLELYKSWGYELFKEYIFHEIKCFKMFKNLKITKE